jgi:hypothetical protein
MKEDFSMNRDKKTGVQVCWNRGPMRFVLAVLALVILVGCSSFKSSQRINLMPFTENTLAIAGDIKEGLGDSRPIYISDHSRGPEVDNYKMEWKKIRSIWRAIIAYSIEIVTISESRISEPEKAQALAQFIEDLKDAAFASPWPEQRLTQEELQEIIEDVRIQQEFLDALSAAQPIIDQIVHLTDYTTERLLDLQLVAAEEVNASIESEHAGLIEYTSLLRTAKYELFRNISLLSRYRRGDSTVLDEMFTSDPSLLEVIDSRENITSKDLQAIERRLIDKLSMFEIVKAQFDPDMELYQHQMRELEDLIKVATSTISRIRVATIVWARTHRKMAAGITDPAKINVMGMASKAMKSALPIP